VSNTLNVRLDTGTKPWSLDVEETHQANVVLRKAYPQLITWQLTGLAAVGSFLSVTRSNPGFSWRARNPPRGVFGKPSLGVDGKELLLPVSHRDKSTKGTWTYQIAARIDGAVYRTRVTTKKKHKKKRMALSRVIYTNPTIVNK
jgi:hypothetical protein